MFVNRNINRPAAIDLKSRVVNEHHQIDNKIHNDKKLTAKDNKNVNPRARQQNSINKIRNNKKVQELRTVKKRQKTQQTLTQSLIINNSSYIGQKTAGNQNKLNYNKKPALRILKQQLISHKQKQHKQKQHKQKYNQKYERPTNQSNQENELIKQQFSSSDDFGSQINFNHDQDKQFLISFRKDSTNSKQLFIKNNNSIKSQPYSEDSVVKKNIQRNLFQCPHQEISTLNTQVVGDISSQTIKNSRYFANASLTKANNQGNTNEQNRTFNSKTHKLKKQIISDSKIHQNIFRQNACESQYNALTQKKKKTQQSEVSIIIHDNIQDKSIDKALIHELSPTYQNVKVHSTNSIAYKKPQNKSDLNELQNFLKTQTPKRIIHPKSVQRKQNIRKSRESTQRQFYEQNKQIIQQIKKNFPSTSSKQIQKLKTKMSDQKYLKLRDYLRLVSLSNDARFDNYQKQSRSIQKQRSSSINSHQNEELAKKTSLFSKNKSVINPQKSISLIKTSLKKKLTKSIEMATRIIQQLAQDSELVGNQYQDLVFVCNIHKVFDESLFKAAYLLQQLYIDYQRKRKVLQCIAEKRHDEALSFLSPSRNKNDSENALKLMILVLLENRIIKEDQLQTTKSQQQN